MRDSLAVVVRAELVFAGLALAACGAATPQPCPAPLATASVAPPASATPAASSLATPSGKPPFASAASLAPHPSRVWFVGVVQADVRAGEPLETAHPTPRLDLSYAGIISSDARAGTINIPESRWACRFAKTYLGDATGPDFFYMSRALACSNDEWRSLVLHDGATASGSARKVERKRATMHLYDGARVIEVFLESCNQSASDDSVDGCVGLRDKNEGDSITVSGIGTVRVHQLTGDVAP